MSSAQKILTRDGKIVTRDGKIVTVEDAATCECCNPCAGLWGPGHDPWPDTVTVSGPSVDGFTGHRVLKCDWVEYSLQQFVQYHKASKRWRCRAWIDSAPIYVYKNGPFSDGPLGDYNLSGDRTSALATVS